MPNSPNNRNQRYRRNIRRQRPHLHLQRPYLHLHLHLHPSQRRLLQRLQQKPILRNTAKKPAKKVPEWASGAALQEALRGPMMYVDPDEIFGPVQTTCDLQGKPPPPSLKASAMINLNDRVYQKFLRQSVPSTRSDRRRVIGYPIEQHGKRKWHTKKKWV
eukprot:COSAG05_NODE_1922_length_3832_cov_1.320922_2_plen_160_part_00